MRLEVFPLFYLLKEFVEKWYNFFLKCLIEFTSEIGGPGAFCFGRLPIVDLSSLVYRSIIYRETYSYYFVRELWQIVSFKELVHFIWVVRFGA